VQSLLANPHSLLCRTWQTLVVRVMGSRMCPYPLWAYTQRMRDWAVAEHALQHLLAADGGRDAFPARAHTSMFAAYPSAIQNVAEIADSLDAAPPLRADGRVCLPHAPAGPQSQAPVGPAARADALSLIIESDCRSSVAQAPPTSPLSTN